MIKRILFSILLILLWLNNSFAVVNIYYSVGQDNTTDNKTGSPTLTVASGVATLTVAQTGNIGVGDRVTYDTSKIAYISGKTSTTVWTLVTATGATPTNEAVAVTVNSIKREYASLSAAESGSTDASHLNTVSLVTADAILNWPCYYDNAADTTTVTVDGYTTSATQYIKIYTPTNTSTEANTSQRHIGVYNTSKYRIETVNNATPLIIKDGHVRIDGLQFYLQSSNAVNPRIILFYEASSVIVAQYYLTNNIIRGHTNSTQTGVQGLQFYDTGGAGSTAYIYNNLIYSFATSGETTEKLFQIFDSNFTFYIYNNTVRDSGSTGIDAASVGILKNNLFANNAGSDVSGTVDNSSNYNATDSASIGYTCTCGANDRLSQTFTFISGSNFHLSSADVGARNFGTDLSGTFTTDIDGQTRSGTWDIGMDEVLSGFMRFNFEEWE